MRLLGNSKVRLLLCVISLLFIVLIQSVYDRSVISIYNRYPLAVIVLIAILLYGVFGKSKIKQYFEMISYLILFFMGIYRAIVEMEGFITFNKHMYGIIEYLKFFVAIILFAILLYYHFTKIFSDLHKN